MSNQQLPRVTDKYLDLNTGQDELIEIGSKRWFAWLENKKTRSFSFSGKYAGHDRFGRWFRNRLFCF